MKFTYVSKKKKGNDNNSNNNNTYIQTGHEWNINENIDQK